MGNVGHIRDVRRLIVAMSRARLGLYVFARVSLFENCYELRPAFTQLMSRPAELFLSPGERYPTQRPAHVMPRGKPYIVPSMEHLAQFVYDRHMEKVSAMKVRQVMAAKKKEEEQAAIAAAEAVLKGTAKTTVKDGDDEKDDEKMMIVNEVEEPPPPGSKNNRKRAHAATTATTTAATTGAT